MTTKNFDYNARVIYVRDAKIFPSLDHEAMALEAAVEAAIVNHKPGEAPVIIGNKLQLIGIEAIRAAQSLKGEKSS